MQKKMAFLLATDSWDKMRVYEGFSSKRSRFVWRIGGGYTSRYLAQIECPINVYFFCRSIVRFRGKCVKIGKIENNNEWSPEDIPKVFRSGGTSASYSTFLLFTKLSRVSEVHVSKFQKWKNPKECFTRGNQGLLRVVDIQ